jgi:hypothetical protein
MTIAQLAEHWQVSQCKIHRMARPVGPQLSCARSPLGVRDGFRLHWCLLPAPAPTDVSLIWPRPLDGSELHGQTFTIAKVPLASNPFMSEGVTGLRLVMAPLSVARSVSLLDRALRNASTEAGAQLSDEESRYGASGD